MNETNVHRSVDVRAEFSDEACDASGCLKIDAPRVDQWLQDGIEILFAPRMVEIAIGIGASSVKMASINLLHRF